MAVRPPSDPTSAADTGKPRPGTARPGLRERVARRTAAAASQQAQAELPGTGTPVALARLALFWERLWPALWPATGFAGLFVALAWMEIFQSLPGWLHGLLALLLLALTLAALVKGLGRVRWPDRTAAVRRLELDNGLPHRPLTAVEDRLAGGTDPVARLLWEAAKARAAARLRSLTPHLPRPHMAARDPWALRVLVVLLLTVGGTAAWGDWGGRLASAFAPPLAAAGGETAATLEAWVDPPEYTGLPPIFLTRQPAAPVLAAATAAAGDQPAVPEPPPFIAIPAGSRLLARVSGGTATPELVANDTALPFAPVAGGGFQVDTVVSAGESLAVRQGGRTLGRWAVRVVPDQVPAIAFRKPPEPTDRGTLRVEYTAGDDYGLERVTAEATLAPGEAIALALPPLELTLPLPGIAPKTANGSGLHDLTAHPWAGFPVLLTLAATDGADQTGRSGGETVILPERSFHHPVAQVIVAERKRLILEGDPAREPAARALSDLSVQPDAFFNDLTAFLALRTSVNRLQLDATAGGLLQVVDILWQTALRIEDGGLSLAERELRDAQDRLAEALDGEATEAEIQELMQELQQAMQQYLDALEQRMREALERGEVPPDMPTDPDALTMDRSELEQMMQQLQDLAETGARDAARQMLSQLQQMLENLQTGQMSPEQQQAAREMQETMQQLQGLAEQQRQLMDETFRQSQQGQSQQGPQDQPRFGPNRQGPMPQPGEQPGQQGPGQPGQPGQQGEAGSGQLSERQEALRRELGDVMRRFGEMGGEIPRQLGRAERAMRDAGQSLGQGAPDDAVPSQGQALDQLQQGLQAMMEQMQQQMGQAGMQPGQRPQAGRQPGRDPLGRPLPGTGMFNTENVEIPAEADVQRAREILEELRRRAGERTRTRQELDYIERLLERF